MIWVMAALAGPEQYAMRGDFSVAEAGLARIELDQEWLARCPDPTSYLIVGPDRSETPYAIRTSDQHPPQFAHLAWSPIEVGRRRWSYLLHDPGNGLVNVGRRK